MALHFSTKSRVWQNIVITTRVAIKQLRKYASQTSKSSSESLIHAKFVILLKFSRIFAIQILSGLARPYTWPIPAIPGYHPSL